MTERAYIGTRKGLFELARGHEAWKLDAHHFLGDPVSMVLSDRRDGTLYAALNLGHFGAKLHRRAPGSRTWTEVAVPVFPPKPEGEDDKTEWTLRQIWSLAAGGPDQPGTLWAGTLPGGLFRSDDRGDSWQLVESLWNMPERKGWFGGGYEWPGIHSICVDPRNSDSVLLGISSGGCWLTEDGGKTWAMRAKGMKANYMPPEQADNQNIQDPHRVVRCAGEPDKLWCQHHGGIWRSVDNGANWTEVKPDHGISNFGFATAVHPKNGEMAWFVPADADQRRVPLQAMLSVSRTTDGGRSFAAYRGGLPHEDCYDLVYRHGLAISDCGNLLVMGSTTGGCWVSEDGGGQWQLVSAHLPPIYSVVFAPAQ